MCWDCSIPVSITTNPPLVDERGNQLLQCDNSTITLTCEANVTFVEPIYQWVSSLNYEKFDEGLSVIKVELRSSPVNYSCVVTDGYITGYANITIVSTGQKPVLTPINFNFNKFTQVGTQTDYNLTARFHSNPPLDAHPKWSFFYNRPVPGSRSYTSVYTNESSGVDYTVLTLSGLSLNDSGYYMVTVSNLCGVSSLLVNVKVVRDSDRCLPGNTTIPPVVKGCMDRATINGELIIYKCSFKGNYNRFRSTMETFWSIESPEQPFTRIDEDRITNYHVTTYPDCITDSRSLCCQFTTELHINVSMFLDGANVSCWADIRNSSNNNNPERVLYSSAKLVVLPRPLITIGLQDTVNDSHILNG
ncbi:uncharacterized protein [Dysidea avara]|uniref:uncharacterized protein isoform X2 n=1 Tax=Dysidea avara TaxID=196820 RepID=UPI00332E2BAF